MILSCSLLIWLLIAQGVQSFTAFPSLHRVQQNACPVGGMQYSQRYPFAAASTRTEVAVDFDVDGSTSENVEGERELVVRFAHMVQNTPAGGLKAYEIDRLRQIMADFSGDIDGIEAAQVVESLLYRLVDEWEAALQADDAEKEEAFRPDARDFAVVMSLWEKSHNPNRIGKVLSLLSDQKDLFINDLSTVQPDQSTIKSVLNSLVWSRDKSAAKSASQVFDSLADFGLTPDPDIYGLTIQIIAKSRTRGAARRAESLLRKAVEQYPPQMEGGVVSGIPVEVFNTVVTAYAKAGEDNGPEQAEQLIVFMDQLDSENGSLGICNPNVNTFTSLIDAYAQQNEWDAVSQADIVLNRLLDQYMEGNDDLEPNVATWTIVISAWMRLSKNNRKGASDRAGRLLKRMEDLSQQNRISFKPDAITYVTCMNAYAFSKNGEGAAEAEQILDEMNEMYLDGDDSMKASSRSIKVVIDSWIKARDMDKAEDLLDKYEDLLLAEENNEISEELKDIYRALLIGYAQQDNMERATFYLNYMVEKGLKPDCFCFDRVIEASTRVNSEKAMKDAFTTFELMEKCFRAGDIKPNERVYTSFIRALTKGRARNLHKKSGMLLQRMHSLYEAGNQDIKPTVFTYNAVLNACSESVHVEDTPPADAFKTAVRVFNELRNGEEGPDHVTFGNMLRCAMLLPEGDNRDKFVSATFRLCCDQGFVNTFVIRDLQIAAPEELWRPLLQCPTGEADLDLLPANWSFMANVANQRGNSNRPPGGGRNNGPPGRGRNNGPPGRGRDNGPLGRGRDNGPPSRGRR